MEFKQIIHNSIYKELYLFEHERRNFYDRLIQYPTTVLVIFIGTSIYCFNRYWPNGILLCSNLDWSFLIFFGLFAINSLITIYYLSIVFHGFSRKYEFFPYADKLKTHEISLYKYFYKYGYKERKQLNRYEALEKTSSEFENAIQKYYVSITAFNQKINDRRANAYYLTRTFLFIDLILLIVIGLISILIN